MNSTFPSGLIVRDYATGGVIAITAIVMVFLVLLAIIIFTEAIGKLIEKSTKETVAPVSANSAPVVNQTSGSPLDINDEDATVAALVASIDYRQETNMNIRVVSVKEVK